MKHILTNNIVENVRRQPFNKASYDHIQEAVAEVFASILKQFTENTTNYFKLHGLIDSNGSPTDYDISAGAVYFNGEVYQVPAFSGSHATNVPVLNFSTTFRSGDPVQFSDSNSFDVHQIKEMVITLAVSGTGVVNLSDLQVLGQGWATGSRIPDGSINTAKIAGSAITSAEIANDAVNTSEIANNAVTSAKIVDGNVTPQKLSVTVVQSPDNKQILTKVIDIGAWNLDTTDLKVVPHGLSLAQYYKIIGCRVIIYIDTLTSGGGISTGYNNGGGVFDLCRPHASSASDVTIDGGIDGIDATNVNLFRPDSSLFNNSSFSSVVVNRGEILIEYLA